jgi:hypothetical protein
MWAVVSFLTVLDAGYKFCPAPGTMAHDYLQHVTDLRLDDIHEGFEHFWTSYQSNAMGFDTIGP